jgi:putative phage-type endonuclease
MMSAEEKAAWLSARSGKLTASRMADAMSFLKNGSPSAARVKYMQELLAERLTGESAPHFVNDAMQWGTDHEDEAADTFVEHYPQYDVRLSHFYDHPTIPEFGATPDREIGEDGLLEVKCPTTGTFVGYVMAGVVPEQYQPQMAAQLLCTGRKWCGFIAYDPRIRKGPKLFLRKFTPTPEYLAEVEAAAVKFLDELQEMFDRFTGIK